MADDLLGLAALRTTVARFDELGRVLGESPDGTSTYEGTDATGAVRAVVDQDGVVTEVRLDRRWRSEMHRNTLADAVLTAIDAAGGARLAAWAERVGPAADSVLRSGEPPAATPVAPAVRPADLSPDRHDRDFATVNLLMNLVERADVELRVGGDNPAAGSVTGTSGGGHVTVRFTGMRVAGVEFDDETNWTVVASHGEIESELADALRNCYRAAVAAEREPAGAALAELRALTADPRKLVELLFDGHRS